MEACVGAEGICVLTEVSTFSVSLLPLLLSLTRKSVFSTRSGMSSRVSTGNLFTTACLNLPWSSMEEVSSTLNNWERLVSKFTRLEKVKTFKQRASSCPPFFYLLSFFFSTLYVPRILLFTIHPVLYPGFVSLLSRSYQIFFACFQSFPPLVFFPFFLRRRFFVRSPTQQLFNITHQSRN